MDVRQGRRRHSNGQRFSIGKNGEFQLYMAENRGPDYDEETGGDGDYDVSLDPCGLDIYGDVDPKVLLYMIGTGYRKRVEIPMTTKMDNVVYRLLDDLEEKGVYFDGVKLSRLPKTNCFKSLINAICDPLSSLCSAAYNCCQMRSNPCCPSDPPIPYGGPPCDMRRSNGPSRKGRVCLGPDKQDCAVLKVSPSLPKYDEPKYNERNTAKYDVYNVDNVERRSTGVGTFNPPELEIQLNPGGIKYKKRGRPCVCCGVQAMSCTNRPRKFSDDYDGDSSKFDSPRRRLLRLLEDSCKGPGDKYPDVDYPRDELARDKNPKDDCPWDEGPRDNYPKDEWCRDEELIDKYPKDDCLWDEWPRNKNPEDDWRRDEGTRDEHPKDDCPWDEWPRNKNPKDDWRRVEWPRDKNPKDDWCRDDWQRDERPRDKYPKDNCPCDEWPRDRYRRDGDHVPQEKINHKGREGRHNRQSDDVHFVVMESASFEDHISKSESNLVFPIRPSKEETPKSSDSVTPLKIYTLREEPEEEMDSSTENGQSREFEIDELIKDVLYLAKEIIKNHKENPLVSFDESEDEESPSLTSISRQSSLCMARTDAPAISPPSFPVIPKFQAKSVNFVDRIRQKALRRMSPERIKEADETPEKFGKLRIYLESDRKDRSGGFVPVRLAKKQKSFGLNTLIS